jgi:hypothetical protein
LTPALTSASSSPPMPRRPRRWPAGRTRNRV